MEYQNNLGRTLDSHLDLIVEILARLQVIEDIILDKLSNGNKEEFISLKARFCKEKDEARSQISEYVFGKFGPDINELLKG